MPTRVGFHAEMRLLEDDLLRLGDMVGSAIEQAVQALTERNGDLAHEIKLNDERINGLYAKIERETLELIATQQPMASDLREILAVFAIATDLERIGDYAKGICNIALRVLDEPPVMVNEIPRMAVMVRELLNGELDAFVRRDAEAARRAAARDDEVDALYGQVYLRLIGVMTEDPQAIERASRLLWAAKGLERAADHITNIGERVVFLITGEIVELNG
jgi:phosphate transport system protein